MIITCNNCSKKFNVDATAIPKNGRLLQCNGCNHKWFFKKEIKNQAVTPSGITIANEEIDIVKEEVVALEVERPKTITLLDEPIIAETMIENPAIKDETKKNENNNLEAGSPKNNKNYNILGLTIVFIVSFIALIIFLDTFQALIARIFPKIEFFLYNLYETINDILLFLNDLI